MSTSGVKQDFDLGLIEAHGYNLPNVSNHPCVMQITSGTTK